MTIREAEAWAARLSETELRPRRSEWYAMQVAMEVRHLRYSMARKSYLGKLRDFILRPAAPPPPITPGPAKAAAAKSVWAARLRNVNVRKSDL